MSSNDFFKGVGTPVYKAPDGTWKERLSPSEKEDIAGGYSRENFAEFIDYYKDRPWRNAEGGYIDRDKLFAGDNGRPEDPNNPTHQFLKGTHPEAGTEARKVADMYGYGDDYNEEALFRRERPTNTITKDVPRILTDAVSQVAGIADLPVHAKDILNMGINYTIDALNKGSFTKANANTNYLGIGTGWDGKGSYVQKSVKEGLDDYVVDPLLGPEYTGHPQTALGKTISGISSFVGPVKGMGMASRGINNLSGKFPNDMIQRISKAAGKPLEVLGSNDKTVLTGAALAGATHGALEDSDFGFGTKFAMEMGASLLPFVAKSAAKGIQKKAIDGMDINSSLERAEKTVGQELPNVAHDMQGISKLRATHDFMKKMPTARDAIRNKEIAANEALRKKGKEFVASVGLPQEVAEEVYTPLYEKASLAVADSNKRIDISDIMKEINTKLEDLGAVSTSTSESSLESFLKGMKDKLGVKDRHIDPKTGSSFFADGDRSVSVKNLWSQKRSINEEMSSSFSKLETSSKEYLNSVGGKISEKLKDYSRQNPDFGVPFFEAENIFQKSMARKELEKATKFSNILYDQNPITAEGAAEYTKLYGAVQNETSRLKLKKSLTDEQMGVLTDLAYYGKALETAGINKLDKMKPNEYTMYALGLGLYNAVTSPTPAKVLSLLGANKLKNILIPVLTEREVMRETINWIKNPETKLTKINKALGNRLKTNFESLSDEAGDHKSKKVDLEVNLVDKEYVKKGQKGTFVKKKEPTKLMLLAQPDLMTPEKRKSAEGNAHTGFAPSDALIIQNLEEDAKKKNKKK